MRSLLTASVVFATLAGTVCAHALPQTVPIRRKSLGFGPPLPHSVFHSSPFQIQTNGFTPQDSAMDPLQVARIFLEDVLGEARSVDGAGKGYKIRDDSYTDKNTGVTHVYVRQLVNGLEVADGDVNLNIKDGVVLSYGNSFYPGPAPAPFTSTAPLTRQEDCDALTSTLASLRSSGSYPQIPMSLTPGLYYPHLFLQPTYYQPPVIFQHAAQCAPPGQYDPADFRPALLHFMALAAASPDVSLHIYENFDRHTESLQVAGTHHFAGHANPEERIAFEVDNVPETVGPVKVRMAYAQVPSSTEEGKMELELVWRFEVEMQDNWYEATVSAASPNTVISVVDWASDSPFAPVPKVPKSDEAATYNVFAWGVNDPSEANRTTQKESFDALASPAGWHTLPFKNDPAYFGARLTGKETWRNTTTTWGNNVFAQENWEGQNAYVSNYRPDGGADKAFDFKYSPKETDKGDALEEAKAYINATVAQLFYTTNMVHDLYYRYGFDELSGNFQQHNFGRGGAENDAVIANAQDGSGYNNANFMTPPDGQNGRMRMYLWNTALPFRDGDLEAGIVIHELSHGLSTRLTGGPANSGCLGWGESGGMGEGWGDWLATTIRSGKEYSDYAMGAWAANREGGIRNYVYSLNDTINPSTYKTLDKPGYWGVHAIGEVWAEILWVVSQRLIAKHGYAEDLFPPQPLANGTVPTGDFYREVKGGKGPLVPKHGNSLAVQLVLNGMKLQICRPSFFDARDAIIQADQVLTGGENFCTLWKGFAARGLGPDAKVEGKTPWGGGVRTNGYRVPTVCEGDEE